MRKLRRKAGKKAGEPDGGTSDTGVWFQPLSGTKAPGMKKGGPMPIHGELFMDFTVQGHLRN